MTDGPHKEIQNQHLANTRLIWRNIKMSNKLQELRKKLQEKENAQSNFSNDNALYPFWNIPYSTDTEIKPAVVRFLPDGNEENDFFWVEVQKIRLSFSGIVGGDSKDVIVSVPCVEMWNETCPILTEIRPWFKGDKETESLARKYWKKRSYIFQGFVRKNPLAEADAPENPIRRFSINTNLFKKIKAGLMAEDMDEMPDDYMAGTDFNIVRTKQTTEIGTFANYDTSGYVRKSTSLTPEEVEAIEKHGLSNLSDFMPKKPDAETVAAIEEMFHASVNGEAYDPDRWGKYYKPAGLTLKSTDASNNETVTQVSPVTSTPKPVVEETSSGDADETSAPWEDDNTAATTETTVEATAPEAKRPPKDILAEIKARANAQKA